MTGNYRKTVGGSQTNRLELAGERGARLLIPHCCHRESAATRVRNVSRLRRDLAREPREKANARAIELARALRMFDVAEGGYRMGDGACTVTPRTVTVAIPSPLGPVAWIAVTVMTFVAGVALFHDTGT